MNIGILQCDDVAPELQPRHGNYPDMIQTLLLAADPRTRFTVYACHQGETPSSTDAHDGWITTGSKCSANDDFDWIRTLSGFMRLLWQADKPLVGICFGHQLMARSMGGQVVRSPMGWGLGVYATTVQEKQPWMSPWYSEDLQLLASHQDQVSELPPGGQILVGSSFCPMYMMQIGRHFLSIQGHPEFTRAYVSDLVNFRRDRIGAERVLAARHSLQLAVHDQLLAHWILNFIARAKSGQQG
ncbi:glutamine amidotransferase-related protein [Castellaniella sp.]|uniref:glutamine amidotransferase-related protein n=1 Tax=Castellaniella sp. TaxID=1955812 RepID=UPI003A8FDCEB